MRRIIVKLLRVEGFGMPVDLDVEVENATDDGYILGVLYWLVFRNRLKLNPRLTGWSFSGRCSGSALIPVG
jgi:hypothetical protein